MKTNSSTTNDPWKRVLVTIIILAAYYCASKARLIVSVVVGGAEIDADARLFLVYGFQMFVCFGITALLNLKSRNNIFEALGLQEKPLKGLSIAFWATIPMLIGFAVTAPFNKEITGMGILNGSVAAGLVEEILFRGFLFGLLFRKVRLGFFPVILLVSIFFGLGHLYQGYGLGSTLGVFLVTAAGSGLFAWLYIEWNYNLWVPIGMHILMNLYWDLFVIDASTALGGALPNLFRFATVALAIFLTVRKIRKSGSLLKGKTFRLFY